VFQRIASLSVPHFTTPRSGFRRIEYGQLAATATAHDLLALPIAAVIERDQWFLLKRRCRIRPELLVASLLFN
jgi:hypothetical protein